MWHRMPARENYWLVLSCLCFRNTLRLGYFDITVLFSIKIIDLSIDYSHHKLAGDFNVTDCSINYVSSNISETLLFLLWYHFLKFLYVHAHQCPLDFISNKLLQVAFAAISIWKGLMWEQTKCYTSLWSKYLWSIVIPQLVNTT